MNNNVGGAGVIGHKVIREAKPDGYTLAQSGTTVMFQYTKPAILDLADELIRLFHDELHYRYLGDWTDRGGNSNIDEGLLTDASLRLVKPRSMNI